MTTSARFEPDPAKRATYDDAYDRYVRLFDALRPEFEQAGRAVLTHRPTHPRRDFEAREIAR